MLMLSPALIVQVSPAAPAPAPSASSCAYDREAALALGFNRFDQDPEAGWRRLAAIPSCKAEAANLIHDYRSFMLAVMPVLYWHEAQLRAEAGDTAAAVSLMERSRQPDEADASGWNPYVDATIAFLRGNRAAFDAARTKLLALPRPAHLSADREWPPNAQVVEGLNKCFGQSYAVAYGDACRR
jgi:hypothetical protein